jgi:PEP-CTERM motif
MSYRLLWSRVQSVVVLVCLSGYAQAGLIEICKNDSPAGSLSGVSTFAIAGQPGTVAVPVGACSPAIQLPDGFATIAELAQPGAALLNVSVFPSDRLISFDAATASAVVLIVAGDISTETVITFTNAPVTGVPEPGTGWLFGLGLTFWAFRAKGKKVRDAACRVLPQSQRKHEKNQPAAETDRNIFNTASSGAVLRPE